MTENVLNTVVEVAIIGAGPGGITAAHHLRRRGIHDFVILERAADVVQPEHVKLLDSIGVLESLRHERHLIDTLDDAITHARSHIRVTRR